MSSGECQVGNRYSVSKADFQSIVDRLKSVGYRVVGPKVADGAVVYDDLDSISRLPFGVIDDQDAGKYRLRQLPEAGYFEHVVGPHSVTQFLFPPRVTIQEFIR